MATEQDAARDRVLAARSELAEEVQVLEASGRAAIDIPARVKRSPAKAAALAGGLGFLLLKGPQRLFRGARRVVRGKPNQTPFTSIGRTTLRAWRIDAVTMIMPPSAAAIAQRTSSLTPRSAVR